MLYQTKFREDAIRMRRKGLVLGIIYRTYLQILLYAKLGRIDRTTLHDLEVLLFPPELLRTIPPVKRTLFRVVRWYNLLPVRLRGVNLLLFRAIISGR